MPIDDLMVTLLQLPSDSGGIMVQVDPATPVDNVWVFDYGTHGIWRRHHDGVYRAAWAVTGPTGDQTARLQAVFNDAAVTSVLIDTEITINGAITIPSGKSVRIEGKGKLIGTGSISGGIFYDLFPPYYSSVTILPESIILTTFTPSSPGLVPASGGGIINFLRADGTFAPITSNATHTGDATGSGALTVVGLRGVTLPALGALAGNLRYTGTGTNTWVFDTATYLTANQSISFAPNAGGDVTGSASGTTSLTPTLVIGANKVTLGQMAQINTATFLGRTTAATGNVEALSATQATALLNVFNDTLKGLVPLSGGGTTNFLRADGTWAAPPASSGTVASVSVVTANGVSGSVATDTTTPAITLVLGAITPSSVNGVALSGSSTPTLAVTGTSAISGTNTGDNAVNSLYSGLVTNATHTGDATGATALTVVGLRGVSLPVLGVSAGNLRYTGTGTNTWVFDTATYLTANQSITFTPNAGGDVTGGASGATSLTPTLVIGVNKVTNAMLAQIPTATFHGRVAAATGNVENLTGTQATTLLDVFTTSLKGLVPASGGGTTNFLRADGTWAAPAGGSLTDGDKVDIIVSGSGATWTIDAGAVTYAKMQNVAANTFLANVTGSPATVQEIATSRIPLFGSAITGTPSASTYLRGDGTWATPAGGSGITSLGISGSGQTGATQTLATGTSGTDFNITSSTNTHTFNIPSASSNNRGLVTTGTQTFAGLKTFTSDVTITPTASTFASPRVLGMSGFSSGEAARWQFGDAANAIQNGFGARMDMFAYWGIRIRGYTQSGTPLALTTGVGGDPSLSVEGTTGDNVVLRVMGGAGQSANLQTWTDNSTAVQASMSTAGAISVTGITSSSLTGAGDRMVVANASGVLSTQAIPSAITDGDKGDITVSASGATWTVDGNAITLAKMQQIATSSFLGRVTAGTGNVEVLTGTQATSLLDTFTSGAKGLVPGSGGGTTNFLRADGSWVAPPAGGGYVVANEANNRVITSASAGNGNAETNLTFDGTTLTTPSLFVTDAHVQNALTLGGNSCSITPSSNSGTLNINSAQGIKIRPGLATLAHFTAAGELWVAGDAWADKGAYKIQTDGAIWADGEIQSATVSRATTGFNTANGYVIAGTTAINYGGEVMKIAASGSRGITWSTSSIDGAVEASVKYDATTSRIHLVSTAGTGITNHLYLATAPAQDDALTQVLVRDGSTGQVKYRAASTLTGAGGFSVSNEANNRVVTSVSAGAGNAESTLTYSEAGGLVIAPTTTTAGISLNSSGFGGNEWWITAIGTGSNNPTALGFFNDTALNGPVLMGTAKMQFISGYQLVWSTHATYADLATPDTGLTRNAAGVIEINNGTAGQFRDLKVRTLFLDTISQDDALTQVLVRDGATGQVKYRASSTLTGGGGGTVTTVSVTTANGISGSVANASSTPAITLTLGAITPSSVNGVVFSGSSTPTLAVTGTSSISGSNTGDNAVNSLYSGLVTNATHTGDATGSGALTVVGLRGVALPALGASAGNLRYTGTGTNTWVFDTATYLTANQSITLSGDISGTGTTAITTTIGANKVTNAMLAQVATASFLGRATAATGNVETLTGTQATTLLDTFTTGLKGLAPASGGGTTNFLRADGTWAAPPAGGGYTVTNEADNRLVTSVSGGNGNAEANLTFDGSLLNVTGSVTLSNRLTVTLIPTNDNALTQVLVRDGSTGEVKYRAASSFGVNALASLTDVSFSTLFSGQVLVYNGENWSNTHSPRINPRVTSNTSTATLTCDLSVSDMYILTAQAVALTIAAPTGTPTEGQKLTIRLEDNGSSQTINFNAIFRASTSLPFPTATTAGKVLYLGFIYNSTDTRWDMVSDIDGF
jgi:hypothetical protein